MKRYASVIVLAMAGASLMLLAGCEKKEPTPAEAAAKKLEEAKAAMPEAPALPDAQKPKDHPAH